MAPYGKSTVLADAPFMLLYLAIVSLFWLRNRMLVNYIPESPREKLPKFDYLIQEIEVKQIIIFIYAVKFKLHVLKHFYKIGKN